MRKTVQCQNTFPKQLTLINMSKALLAFMESEWS